MGSGQELVKHNARKKGWSAAGAGLTTTGAVIGCVAIGAPGLAVVAAIGGGLWTAQRAYQWLRYRGEWGLKF